MRPRLIRWPLRLLAGAMLYPIMQFVVLPMVRAQGFALGENTSRLPADRSQAEVLNRNARTVNIGGHQMQIAPALNSGSSVRFEMGKGSSSSSANCKPGST